MVLHQALITLMAKAYSIDITGTIGYICSPKLEQKKFSSYKKLYRGVEQLVARRAHNPKVVGSSPAPATKRKSPLIGEGFYFLNFSYDNRLSEIKGIFYQVFNLTEK